MCIEHDDETKNRLKTDPLAVKLGYFDDDWYRYFDDGSTECHELCAGCNPDDSCDFHPVNCDCCGDNGECHKIRTTK